MIKTCTKSYLKNEKRNIEGWYWGSRKKFLDEVTFKMKFKGRINIVQGGKKTINEKGECCKGNYKH